MAERRRRAICTTCRRDVATHYGVYRRHYVKPGTRPICSGSRTVVPTSAFVS